MIISNMLKPADHHPGGFSGGFIRLLLVVYWIPES